MSLGKDLEQAAEVAAPQIGIPILVVKIVGGLLVVALAVFVIWKLFFAERAAQAKHDEVQQQVSTGLAKTGAESGKQAVEITVKNNTNAAGIDRDTRKAIDDLLKAPGANSPVDPGLAMLARRAICLRLSAADLDGCHQLRGPGAGGMAPDGH